MRLHRLKIAQADHMIALPINLDALDAPRAILRRLDREIGAINKELYPTDFADWFYKRSLRWLNALIVSSVVLSVVAALLHAPQILVIIGFIICMAGVALFVVGSIAALAEMLREGWRALDDGETRGSRIASREDVAMGTLRDTREEAIRLERKRVEDRISAANFAPSAFVVVATGYFGVGYKIVSPAQLTTVVQNHGQLVLWLAFVAVVVFVFSKLIASQLQRHLDLLTTALGEDPLDKSSKGR